MDLLGSREEAAELLDELSTRTRTVAPLVRAAVLTSAALATALGRDLGRARAHAAEALRLAGRLPVWSSYATAVLEWTKAVAGDPAPTSRSCAAASTPSRRAAGSTWSRGASACSPRRRRSRGGTTRRCGSWTTRWAGSRGPASAWARRSCTGSRAWRCLAAARPAAARAAFDEAVTVARRQGSTLLARRAAEDLRALSYNSEREPAAGIVFGQLRDVDEPGAQQQLAVFGERGDDALGAVGPQGVGHLAQQTVADRRRLGRHGSAHSSTTPDPTHRTAAVPSGPVPPAARSHSPYHVQRPSGVPTPLRSRRKTTPTGSSTAVWPHAGTSWAAPVDAGLTPAGPACQAAAKSLSAMLARAVAHSWRSRT